MSRSSAYDRLLAALDGRISRRDGQQARARLMHGLDAFLCRR